jgi:hypothetical protein
LLAIRPPKASRVSQPAPRLILGLVDVDQFLLLDRAPPAG